MACIKEYMCGNARIRIMDDDIAPPEDQEQIKKQLMAIAWEVKREFAQLPKEEQDRRNEAARRFRAALDARPIVPISQ